MRSFHTLTLSQRATKRGNWPFPSSRFEVSISKERSDIGVARALIGTPLRVAPRPSAPA